MAERITNLTTQMAPNGTVAARTVTVSSAAINLINTTLLSGTTSHVQVTFTGANLRYTIDGTTPSATVGHQIIGPTTVIWHADFATKIKCIREGVTDVTAYISELVYL